LQDGIIERERKRERERERKKRQEKKRRYKKNGTENLRTHGILNY